MTGFTDHETWVAMTDVEKWAYVQRLEASVLELGQKLGTETGADRCSAGRAIQKRVGGTLRFHADDGSQCLHAPALAKLAP
jgi:hypothetical protein